MEQTKNLSSWLVALFACAALVACLGLAGCGGNSAASSSAAADSSSAAAEEEADAPEVGGGFEETPIFEDQTAGGWLNVSAGPWGPT